MIHFIPVFLCPGGRIPERESDGKADHAVFVRGGNSSRVQVHDRLRNGKSQTGPAGGAGFVAAVESVKDVFSVFPAQFARVLCFDHDRSAAFFRTCKGERYGNRSS